MMYKNSKLDFLANKYGWLISLGTKIQSLFLLWMRLTWGHQFILTGSSKLANIAKTTEYFSTLHLHHPQFHAYLVGYTELLGGVFLILGLCSRLIAIPLIIITVSALSIAHSGPLSDFRFLTDPSSLVLQAPYPFLITALLVFCFGPGGISLDAWIKRWVHNQPQY